MPEPTSTRDFLRHVLATLSYRAGKALRGAPSSFADYRCSPESRTPVEILAHMGDLFDWAVHHMGGEHVWRESEPLPWDEEVARFFDGLARADERLASSEPLGCSETRLFQGPFADALTHVGQLAMLRRMHGEPVRAENYFKAEIEGGRTGTEQAEPVYEFDRPEVGSPDRWSRSSGRSKPSE